MEELVKAFGKNCTILAIFFNVLPEKIKETVGNKLLVHEDIKSIAFYVYEYEYITTYLKYQQSFYEIRYCKSAYKIPNDLTINDIEIKLTIEFLKKDLDT